MKMAISSVDLQTAIGRRIAKLRKDHGMGQLELCGELDVSVKHLSECERGVSMFSLERLLDICEIFDVSLDYLCFKDVVSQQENEFKEKYNQLSDKRKEVIINVIDSYNDEAPKSSTTSGKKLR